MKADGRPTISQVAEAAGVSRATVSRVMNERDTVDPRLAERVRTVAAELGYEPHPVARSLALGRTGIVALVVPDLTNPVFQGILQGLDEVAARAGHRVLVADSREDVAAEPALATGARDRCDGLVLCAPRMDTELLRRLAPRLAPLVVVNRVADGLAAPSVAVDHAAGIRQVVDHLRGLGHRTLAYLAGPPSSASNRERLEELRLLARRHDLGLEEIPCGSGSDAGYAAAGGLVHCGATAVIAYNDMVALGALHGLGELGVDVPGTMSLVGFDDIPFARWTSPSMTTAAVPQRELGAQAWARLHALLRGEEPAADTHVVPVLQVRGSTGPPRVHPGRRAAGGLSPA